MQNGGFSVEHEDLRVVRTRRLVQRAFLDCLAEKGFLALTVRDITERAGINRSTFYKHYQDKYDLRDRYVDEVVADFTAHLDIGFISLPEITDGLYFQRLRLCLLAFEERREEYLALWGSNLQERNVIEEMLSAGMTKLIAAFEADPDIPGEKRPMYSFYARMFLTCMLASIRWWFTDGTWMGPDAFTHLMIQHMSRSFHATLRDTAAPE